MPFTRFFSTAEPDITQRQEGDIMQSRLNLDGFLPIHARRAAPVQRAVVRAALEGTGVAIGRPTMIGRTTRSTDSGADPSGKALCCRLEALVRADGEYRQVAAGKTRIAFLGQERGFSAITKRQRRGENLHVRAPVLTRPATSRTRRGSHPGLVRPHPRSRRRPTTRRRLSRHGSARANRSPWDAGAPPRRP